MNAALFLKKGLLVTSLVLLASCARHHGMAGAGMTDGEAMSQGLGQFTRFAGQQAGESYTTKTPHNQLYLFSYDESALNPKYVDSLNAQADYLRSHPSARVLIAGHTDERGSREYNISLGEHRADSVAEYLRMAGIRHSQYRIVSYGKERPANFGHDDASHAQNRRAEFIYEATR